MTENILDLPLLLNAFDIPVPCSKYVCLHIRVLFGSEVAAKIEGGKYFAMVVAFGGFWWLW